MLHAGQLQVSARRVAPAAAGLALLGILVCGLAAPPAGSAAPASTPAWRILQASGPDAPPVASLRTRGGFTVVRRVRGSAYAVHSAPDAAAHTVAGARYRVSAPVRAGSRATVGRRLAIRVLERDRRGATRASWRRTVTLKRKATLGVVVAPAVGDGNRLEVRLVQVRARDGDAFEVGPVRVVVRTPQSRPATRAAPAPAAIPPPAGNPPAPETSTPLAPIDPFNQTALQFGDRSHWLQPWRGYLDTPPAADLRNAVGINLNVEPGDLAATARLAAANGIARARVEVGWNVMSYDDPGAFADPARVRTLLTTLDDNGLRPLILLNANHGEPGPVRRLTLVTTAAAPAGARTIQLNAASAAAVVPGRTGLNARDRFKAAAVIITGVDGDGVATLSQPLPSALPAGGQPASTLRFAPFARPTLAGGAPNPAFEATLGGWLDYARAIAVEAEEVLGAGNFDVEVWNELSFGSDFLDINRYYDPDIDTGTGTSDPFFVTTAQILRRTVDALRDPALGLGPIGIGSGFSSQRPWDAGSTSPAGLSALSKHPYPPRQRFPQDQTPSTSRALDAQGRPDGTRGPNEIWQGAFTPTYQAYFPEHYLAAIQTEHIVRDLSPITTSIFGTAHGRLTSPPGAPAPRVWLTEVNMSPADALDAAAVARFRAKVALRSVLAFTAKGVEAVHLYAALDPTDDHQLVDQGFYDALDAGTAYPGDDAGGPALIALRRLAAAAGGPDAISDRRALSLVGVGGGEIAAEFAGDGTAAHPDLVHRELVAAFPFQADERRFVVGAYVMTRDLERVRRPELAAGDPARYDLTPSSYRLRLSGLRSCDLTVRATDPLDGAGVPARVVACAVPEATVEVPLTDSPRFIEIGEPAP